MSAPYNFVFAFEYRSPSIIAYLCRHAKDVYEIDFQLNRWVLNVDSEEKDVKKIPDAVANLVGYMELEDVSL